MVVLTSEEICVLIERRALNLHSYVKGRNGIFGGQHPEFMLENVERLGELIQMLKDTDEQTRNS